MSMKRVKVAPIRHFYENIFYGEDLTSLSSDEMKRNLPKALERWDYPEWKKEICAARLIREESFAELSERFHYSEGHIRNIIRTVETYLRRDGNYGIRIILLTGCDTYGESMRRKKEYEESFRYGHFTLGGVAYRYENGSNPRESALNRLEAWLRAAGFPARKRVALSQHFQCRESIDGDPVELLLHMTPEHLMGEVRGCTSRMAREIEARLEKAGYQLASHRGSPRLAP